MLIDPPGRPEITGYTADQVLKTGDTARLVCVSRGGNPLAQVYWYRDGQVISSAPHSCLSFYRALLSVLCRLKI